MHTFQLGWLGLAALFVSSAAGADGSSVRLGLDFDFSTDSLCFTNGRTEEVRGFPLPQIARGNGACHGWAYLVSAARNHIEFDCSEGTSPMSEYGVRRSLEEAIRTAYLGCERRVRIEGFCSLRELCRRRQRVVESVVLETNAGVFFRELDEYLNRSPHSRDLEAAWRLNAVILDRVAGELARGRAPVITYCGGIVCHSVVPFASERKTDDWGREVVWLRVADPNSPSRMRTLIYQLEDKGRMARAGLGRSRNLVAIQTPSRASSACRRRSPRQSSDIFY